MTIIRNKSGGPASLFSVGAIGIADDGDFDTDVVSDGLPLASDSKVQSSSDVLAAMISGQWCVVVDGTELGSVDSVQALTPSSVSSTGGSFNNPWQTLAPNPADRTWVDLPGCEWTVSDDQSWGAVVDVNVAIGNKPGGGVVRLTIIKDGLSTASMEDEDDRFGRIPGFDIRADRNGSTATVQLKRNGTAAVRVWTHGTATEGEL